jgi:hypothetical protein
MDILPAFGNPLFKIHNFLLLKGLKIAGYRGSNPRESVLSFTLSGDSTERKVECEYLNLPLLVGSNPHEFEYIKITAIMEVEVISNLVVEKEVPHAQFVLILLSLSSLRQMFPLE